LGYAYYKQNDFENAISQFNKIINGKDFVAQNAYYHLGESYLKLDKKQEALNAFKMLLKCRLTLQSRKTRV
jgi:TolA-binding protein